MRFKPDERKHNGGYRNAQDSIGSGGGKRPWVGREMIANEKCSKRR